jgi:XTP/dITP diphosphohydrolase
MNRLILASSNKGKLEEYKFMAGHLADFGFEKLPSEKFEVLLATDVDESIVFKQERGKTYLENSVIKAKGAFIDLFKKGRLHEGDVVFGDDTGLEIEGMPGELGLYTARFLGEETPQSKRNEEVVKRLNETGASRNAKFICSIAYINCNKEFINSFQSEKREKMESNIRTATVMGETEGTIAKSVTSGSNGFGYDPVFVPSEYNKAFADCSQLEKCKVSHRQKAFSKMIKNILGL